MEEHETKPFGIEGVTSDDEQAVSRASLEWLLGASQADSFLTDAWEKLPFRVHRSDPNYYRGVLDPSSLDFAIHQASRHVGSLELLGNSEGPRFPRNHRTVMDAVRDGRSFRINGLQRFAPGVHTLKVKVEQAFSCLVNINLYYTPAGGKALGSHYDTHDVFALQLMGRKWWMLFDSAELDPLEFLPLLRGESRRDQKIHRIQRQHDAPCNQTERFALNGGDLLYLPRGFRHEAEGDRKLSSCHLTVGLQPYTYADLAIVAIGEAARRMPELRASIPMRKFLQNGQHPEARQKLDTELRANLAAITNQLALEEHASTAIDFLTTLTIRNRAALLQSDLLSPATSERDIRKHEPDTEPSWLPVRLNTNRKTLEWIAFKDRILSEPFFRQTVKRIENSSNESVRSTPLRKLRRFATEPPPAGIIFHISRCGSTLIANAMRTLPDSSVISEPEVINQLLTLPPDDLAADEILLGAVGSYTRFGHNRKQRTLFKLSSWNVLQAALFRRLWPETPFLFVIRDPIEVSVSCLLQPPGWLRWNRHPKRHSNLPGLPIQSSSPERDCAAMIGTFLQIMVTEAAHPQTTVIDYRSINGPTCLALASRFGMQTSGHDVEAMDKVLQQYSKDPSRTFVSDSRNKHRQASDLLRSAVAELAGTSYSGLLESALRSSVQS